MRFPDFPLPRCFTTCAGMAANSKMLKKPAAAASSTPRPMRSAKAASHTPPPVPRPSVAEQLPAKEAGVAVVEGGHAGAPTTPPPKDREEEQERTCTNCGDKVEGDDYVMAGACRTTVRCGDCNRTLGKIVYHKLGASHFTGLGEDEKHDFFQKCKGKSSGQLVQWATEVKERMKSAIHDTGTSNIFRKPLSQA